MVRCFRNRKDGRIACLAVERVTLPEKDSGSRAILAGGRRSPFLISLRTILERHSIRKLSNFRYVQGYRASPTLIGSSPCRIGNTSRRLAFFACLCLGVTPVLCSLNQLE